MEDWNKQMTTSQAISTITLLREEGDDCEQLWNYAFQQLIDEDVVWTMSMWWKRRATELISKGFCQLPIE
jgi:hypothetical protein